MDVKATDLGYGQHTLQIAVEDLCQDLDPLLVQRKGRLTLLAASNTDTQILTWICRDYYSSRSFDAIPTLVHSLSQAYRDHAGLENQLYLIAVQRGLDVSMVGHAETVVRLARYNVVRDLFDARAGQSGYRVALTEHPGAGLTPTLYSTVWRVVKGDMLLFTTRSAAERIGTGTLSRIARQGGTASNAARALARAGRTTQSAPLIVIRFAQISPVPDVPAPVRSETEPAPAPVPRSPRQGVSPVLVAGLIALAAVIISFWATGARLDPGEIPGYVKMVLFPEPTPTATPTPSPDEERELESSLIYVAPELVTPYDGARMTGSEVALVWDWPLDLAANERFEVILQPPGGDPEARTLTRERRHSISQGAEGWYAWTVRVVDVTDSKAPIALSARAAEVSFHWGAD
ncbi:MAG: hypothetical protein ACYCYF_04890 [Anaerolineae bacterium]